MTAARKPGGPWDTDKAAELAAEALAYLAHHYPECAGSEALREHEDAAHEAAMDAARRGTGKPYAPTVGPVETRPYGYEGVRHERDSEDRAYRGAGEPRCQDKPLGLEPGKEGHQLWASTILAPTRPTAAYKYASYRQRR